MTIRHSLGTNCLQRNGIGRNSVIIDSGAASNRLIATSCRGTTDHIRNVKTDNAAKSAYLRNLLLDQKQTAVDLIFKVNKKTKGLSRNNEEKQ